MVSLASPTTQTARVIINNQTKNKMTIKYFPKDKIDEAQKLVSDCTQTCEDSLPQIPKDIESDIDEYIEKIRSEAIRIHGNDDALFVLPFYKQMMRIGALIAISHHNELAEPGCPCRQKGGDE